MACTSAAGCHLLAPPHGFMTPANLQTGSAHALLLVGGVDRRAHQWQVTPNLESYTRPPCACQGASRPSAVTLGCGVNRGLGLRSDCRRCGRSSLPPVHVHAFTPHTHLHRSAPARTTSPARTRISSTLTNPHACARAPAGRRALRTCTRTPLPESLGPRLLAALRCFFSTSAARLASSSKRSFSAASESSRRLSIFSV